MDSLYMSYRIDCGETTFRFDKYLAAEADRKFSPQFVAEMLREWANDIEDRDLDGNFDRVK